MPQLNVTVPWSDEEVTNPVAKLAVVGVVVACAATIAPALILPHLFLRARGRRGFFYLDEDGKPALDILDATDYR